MSNPDCRHQRCACLADLDRVGEDAVVRRETAINIVRSHMNKVRPGAACNTVIAEVFSSVNRLLFAKLQERAEILGTTVLSCFIEEAAALLQQIESMVEQATNKAKEA